MEIIKRFQADRFVRQLQSGSPLTEPQLAEARSQLKVMGASAVRALFAACYTNPATEATLDVLVRLVNPPSLPSYLEALRSPSPTIMDAAARALGRATSFDPLTLFTLYSDDRYARNRVEGILEAQLPRLQADVLLRLLPELGKEARISAIRLIDKLADERVVDTLAELAQHPEWWIRLQMAKLLARFPGAGSNAATTRLVHDENAAVRLEAVRAATRLRATGAIPALCTRLHDQDMKVQSAAIEALVSMADVSAVPHLLDALKDESEYVRRGAVEVLNEVVTTDAIKDLVSALKDADWWVRVRSADALGTNPSTCAAARSKC